MIFNVSDKDVRRLIKRLKSEEITPVELNSIDLIRVEFIMRGKRFPSTEEAMLWLQTEVGEATDELMKKKRWVRNKERVAK